MWAINSLAFLVAAYNLTGWSTLSCSANVVVVKVVQPQYLIAACQPPLGHSRPDQSRYAGEQDFHGVSLIVQMIFCVFAAVGIGKERAGQLYGNTDRTDLVLYPHHLA